MAHGRTPFFGACERVSESSICVKYIGERHEANPKGSLCEAKFVRRSEALYFLAQPEQDEVAGGVPRELDGERAHCARTPRCESAIFRHNETRY